MSEEILQALIRLFAILSRQGNRISDAQLQYVREYLEDILSETDTEHYYNSFLSLLNLNRQDNIAVYETSPIDSIEVIGICYRINETLQQNQKIIVLVKCLELIGGGTSFPQSEEILITCADIFKISREEYSAISRFVQSRETKELQAEEFLLIGDSPEFSSFNTPVLKRHIHDSFLAVHKVDSVNIYFIKLNGPEKVLLNGNIMVSLRIYIMPIGSVISTPANRPLYYSTLVDAFRDSINIDAIQFDALDVQYRFKNGKLGIQKTNFTAHERNLIAIMGGSGSGKTTLLSVLSGIEKPTSGQVLINHINISDKRLAGKIGYVSQDDLLIEELTVFQNLYYNSKLVFGEMPEQELTKKVDHTLKQLGLFEARDLRVGSIHDKVLSGGQRKRLNIGLEIIRNPTVMFLDEPISGLSSKDSENVMSLLAELRQKGRLIFVVIHQPSSDIYKLFDKILLVDKGGYCIYYGNPIEALSYFKGSSNKINKEITHCLACGNVQAQEIFDIIEEKVLNEYGLETSKRKKTPEKWFELFQTTGNIQTDKRSDDRPLKLPERSEKKPSRMRQFGVYLMRDAHSKLANLSYAMLVLFEPVILSIILSFLVKRSSTTHYTLLENDNIPAYIFMSIIVIIFIGLTISAEEIFRDRKILFRERFLELSRFSYLGSKVFLLCIISAIQALVFVVIGNFILEIRGNNLIYWFMLFTLACNANLIGLNISASFKSAVTIYILIPLLIIPQMILGGAMFNYEDLHKSIDDKGYAPGIAGIIPARWAYEGLMVAQFRYNDYQNMLYPYDSELSKYRYKNGAFLSELYKLTDYCLQAAQQNNCDDSCKFYTKLIYREIETEASNFQAIRKKLGSIDMSGGIDEFSSYMLKSVLADLSATYQQKYNRVLFLRDNKVRGLTANNTDIDGLDVLKKTYHNNRTAHLVKKGYSENKIVVRQDGLERLYEPIYLEEPNHKGFFSKSLYFVSQKNFFTWKMPTYFYNSLIIWIFTGLLLLLLYFNGLKALFRLFDRITIFKFKSKKIP